MQETIDLIEEARPDFYRVQLWYCDPVTPIWNKREEHGIQGSAFNWSHDTMDCQTACDLIDEMFATIQGSVWLPQNGFEQWSTFYLQRKGMTMEQIKTYLRSFNACVKEKLIHPERKNIDPELLRSLERDSLFDEVARPAQAVAQPIEAAAI